MNDPGGDAGYINENCLGRLMSVECRADGKALTSGFVSELQANESLFVKSDFSPLFVANRFG